MVNVFDRYFGSLINIDGRDEAINDPDPTAPTKQCSLVISPATQQLGLGSTVRVTASIDGQPVVGKLISFSNSNGAVTSLPTTGVTGADGSLSFEAVALEVGSTTIVASWVDGSITVASESRLFTVSTVTPPEDYSVTGYGTIEQMIEPSISAALVPNIVRLSNAAQQLAFPGDRGLEYVADYENKEITFWPDWMR
jgi:uncharacterized protein YjdB